MFSRFTHVVAWVSASLFVMPEQYSVVWLHHIVFIHSSIHAHVGCFHLLASVNSAAMNICVQEFIHKYRRSSIYKGLMS